MKARAISIGVTATGPSVNDLDAIPSGTATRKTRMPRAAGPTMARRVSSSDQAIGWSTVTRTATRVSATMRPTNSRFPPLVAASAGTAMAISPRTVVPRMKLRMSRILPSADRPRMSTAIPATAYSPTHLEARARPSNTPTIGSTIQNAHGLRQRPVHSGANRA